jgi:3-oxoacyl-[acyl-carrier-protein] synthase-1
MTYIGAEVMISPLGGTAEANWLELVANRSGISRVEKAGFHQEDIYLSKILDAPSENLFTELVIRALTEVEARVDAAIMSSARTIVIISSTKGALDQDVRDQFETPVRAVTARFNLAHTPFVVSNACISGVLAINTAGNLIRQKMYDHAIVVGCDVISDFVLFGFQSLFAVSDKPCAPFDASRNGITLGEGCGAVVVSCSKDVYKNPPLELLTGVSANDANHISGPSRTGEGLFRSVRNTLKFNQVAPDEIDFISAHGTATLFNDEMEAIAFDRVQLSHVPLNSFKGYFGHTLGAAGVIETAASMQMMRDGVLLKSIGYSEPGTSRALNIVDKNKKKDLKTILKTASGFGGGNASLMIRSL